MQKGIKKIGWAGAAALVVANMIGTGAFTTLGLQLEVLDYTWSILLLWTLGGVISLFGAFSYAELSTHLPRSGGEYHFLSKIIHPFVGYLSGWISLTVGFAAAIALAAMAVGAYLQEVLQWPSMAIALGILVTVATIHSFSIRRSRNFQVLFTILMVLLLLFFIISGFWLDSPVDALRWGNGWKEEVLQPAFAVSLIYVLYAYSGWNAAAYIVEEVGQPRVNIPRALVFGTLLVTVLYLLLQVVFLRQVSATALSGEVEVGQIVAEQMFGPLGGYWVSLAIAFFLVSSISAMIWVGPRVSRVMAEDYPLWRFLAYDNKKGIPVAAIWFQVAISTALIISGSFETVLVYSGFVLQLSTALTVASVFILRRRGLSGGFRSPGYPWFQIAFLIVSIWMMFFLLIDRPVESLLGMANLLLGGLTYWVNRRMGT